jgi:hypothetical protein
VINIKGGEFQDIFKTILVTNWGMGILVLIFVTFYLKRHLNIPLRKLFFL